MEQSPWVSVTVPVVAVIYRVVAMCEEEVKLGGSVNYKSFSHLLKLNLEEKKNENLLHSLKQWLQTK